MVLPVNMLKMQTYHYLTEPNSWTKMGTQAKISEKRLVGLKDMTVNGVLRLMTV
jgi:hypothetical protein|nr:MAG TPA: hypothetical protein [Caudoviricetes sp.]